MAVDRLGRYELLRPLGSGGSGRVFLARDLAAGRVCALKRLGTHVRCQETELRREFDTLTRLRHPTIVSVYDFGWAPDDVPFYTMEYVPGRPPHEALAQGDWCGLIGVGAEIAHGLDVLHSQKIVHGDLKPSNVIAMAAEVDDGRTDIRLVDFGMARLIGDPGGGHSGSLGFAAPEVVRGEAPSASTDLYALGALLYYLATRRHPFEGESAAEVLRRQQSEAVDRTHLERASTPGALADIILKLLARRREDRLSTARETWHELKAIHQATNGSHRPRFGNATVVGRERELGRMEPLFGRPMSRSRMFVALGSRGSGKTAFLDEVASRARLAGHPVHRLLSVANGKPAIAPREDAPAQASRGAAPFAVYVLDDYDRIESATLAALPAALFGGTPCLVVAARDPAQASPENERLLRETGLLDMLSLEPLDREGTSQLLAARLRGEAPSRLVDFVHRRAQGHPGLSVALLEMVSVSGALTETDAGLVVDGEAIERLDVPSDFERAARARLDLLPDEARRALGDLAVLGPIQGPDLRGLDLGISNESLSILRAQGLIRCEGESAIRLMSPFLAPAVDEHRERFLHEAALRLPGLSTAERFRHLRGAGHRVEALRVAMSSEGDGSLLEAAAALVEKEEPGVAAECHEKRVRLLFGLGRYEAAIPPLERALALEPASARRVDRLYMLSTAHLRCGHMNEVANVIAEALRGHPTPELRSRLLTNDAARKHASGDLQGAEETAREALARAGEARDPDAEALAAQSLAYILLTRGDLAEAESVAERAATAAASGSGFVQARAETARGAVAQAKQEFPLAAERYRSALQLARRQKLRLVTEELLIELAIVSMDLGEWEEARRNSAEAVRSALEDHRPRNAAAAMVNLAHTMAMTGRPRTARRSARQAIRMARSFLPALEPSAWRALCRAELCRGRLAEAGRAARRAVELAGAHAAADEAAWCAFDHGRVLEAEGNLEGAIEVWREALTRLPASFTSLACLLGAHAGSALLRRGSADAAAGDLEAVKRHLERGTLTALAAAHARRFQAEAAMAGEQWQSGLRLASEVLAELERWSAPAEHAYAAVLLAEQALETSRAHRAPVLEWLERATENLERFGDRRAHRRATQALIRSYRTRSVAAPIPGRRELLSAISSLLNALSDLRELAERAMGMVVEQLGAERGVFLIRDRESGQLTPISEWGSVDDGARRRALKYSQRVVERVVKGEGSLLITDAPMDPRAVSVSVMSLKLRSILCVPLHACGSVAGAIYLDDSRRPQAFDETDRDLLEGVANVLAVAIDRSLAQQELERTNATLWGENNTLRRELKTRFRSHLLVGTSQAMQRILPLIERATQTTCNVLLTGETGTGKELVARIIHYNSKREDRPFVIMNCPGIPASLFESEVFGIKSGAATGVVAREGLIRQAHGGTLFLDEVADLPLLQQAGLLSFLGNRELAPIGTGDRAPLDVRIIAATNRDLCQLIDAKEFRDDLYHRLNVFQIEIPPLRDRTGDLPALVRHFVEQVAVNQGQPVPDLSADFLDAVARSRWPGNVRGLFNYIEQVMARTPGRVLRPDPLPVDLRDGQPSRLRGPLTSALDDIERRMIEEALQRCDGNQSLAARELGLTEAGMRYRMRRLGLSSSRQKPRPAPQRRTSK